jgi:hypothetical protein
MAHNNNNQIRTHIAWAIKREGKKFGRWLEVGNGRLDAERNCVHVFMDRLPIGGFTGYVLLSPIGEIPPVPEPQPRRPEQPDDEDGLDE